MIQSKKLWNEMKPHILHSVYQGEFFPGRKFPRSLQFLTNHEYANFGQAVETFK